MYVIRSIWFLKVTAEHTVALYIQLGFFKYHLATI